MRRGAAKASGIGAQMFYHVPSKTVVDPITRDCRGRHKMRVISFSYEKREITERCAACGQEQARTFARGEKHGRVSVD